VLDAEGAERMMALAAYEAVVDPCLTGGVRRDEPALQRWAAPAVPPRCSATAQSIVSLSDLVAGRLQSSLSEQPT